MKKVWMDSGAYSAKTLGAEISLQRYCHWLQRYAPFIDHYAVLDAIGNDEKSAQTTLDNQTRMEDKFGLTPVPCFHYGEPLRFLEHYVEEYGYVALGGMVPIDTPQLKLWLDELWCNYLTFAGTPIIKVHGFGMTVFELMARYPWYSVDSSSWLMGGRNGSCLFMVNGVPTALGCSAMQAGSGTLAGLGEDQREALLRYASRALVPDGADCERVDISASLQDSYIARNLVTLYTFEQWRAKWVEPVVGTRPELTLFEEPDGEEMKSEFNQFRVRMDRALPKGHKLDIYYAGCWPGGWKLLPNYPRMFSYHYIDQHGGKKAVNFNMVDEFLAVVKSKGG